ncbi:MAG: hypothetical protein ACOYD1_12775 [Candidatus Nanopelagicales bacterium]
MKLAPTSTGPDLPEQPREGAELVLEQLCTLVAARVTDAGPVTPTNVVEQVGRIIDAVGATTAALERVTKERAALERNLDIIRKVVA